MKTTPDGFFDPAELWTQAKTERYLANHPLPLDFHWRHDDGTQQPVQPRGGIKNGYGFWLRYTPYFPGLFEEIHAIIALTPATDPDGKPFQMTPQWLAAKLDERRPQGTQTDLFAP
jgi:hypothetical protein